MNRIPRRRVLFAAAAMTASAVAGAQTLNSYAAPVVTVRESSRRSLRHYAHGYRNGGYR